MLSSHPLRTLRLYCLQTTSASLMTVGWIVSMVIVPSVPRTKEQLHMYAFVGNL